MLNLHRDKNSKGVNRGENGRSLVTTGRIYMQREASYRYQLYSTGVSLVTRDGKTVIMTINIPINFNGTSRVRHYIGLLP